MTRTRVGVVLGTRPEAIKLAPVVGALRRSDRYEPVVVSTGQQRDLLEQLLGYFDLAPDADLDLMVPGQSLSDLAGRALQRIGSAIETLGLDVIVVQGDTTTTLAGALAGFYRKVPVVHVEAGLRTGDKLSPYPEEANRRLVTHVADLHLAPTSLAADALLREGVDPRRVLVPGNTVVDSLFLTRRRDRPYTGPEAELLTAVHESDRRVLLVTAHRRESWGSGLDGIADAVARIVDAHPDVVAVFPVHPNPLVRASADRYLAGKDRVLRTDPLSYPDFVRLLARSDLVLTDSGGIQEEACTLGKPTLVARDVTERPEGEAAGGLRLVGTDAARIAQEAHCLLTDQAAYQALVCTSMPFGDGRAAERIVTALDLVAPPPPTSIHHVLEKEEVPMRSSSSRLLSTGGALFLAAALVLSGCSADPDESSDQADTPTASATPAQPESGSGAGSGSGSGSAATDPATDPNSPFVVAASAVGTRSRDQVLQLHALSISTTQPRPTLPVEQVPGLARSIDREVGRQIADASTLPPPPGTPAAQLVAALGTYQDLAGQLAEWKPQGGRPLSSAFFDRLRGADKAWRTSLRRLSRASGQDLLADLPELITPAEGTSGS
ncbi:hypothetical protein BH09ACT12_BH09ACT12_36960 [soil metagenome]